MKLLRELMHKQHESGCLSDETLREMARALRVPLYRLEGLVSFYTHFRRVPPKAWTIDVCRDVCCARGRGMEESREILERLARRDDVEVREVSCLGRCDSAPAHSVNDVPLASLERLLNRSAASAHARDESASIEKDWKCDPYERETERYGTVRGIARAGGDWKAAALTPLIESGLRGCGGAGFPAGQKWEFVASRPEETKYVICNADESEPGTFKDREILRSLPHLVIEGMLLAALTTGAEEGIVYLRHEYEPERKAFEGALAAARSGGILGKNAAGSGKTFDIEIFISPGGYILGEETALLEALEDKRGEPRNKPPYPGQAGLRGKPTLINNVETFALATTIVHHGAAWWKQQGVRGCEGLKFVCISGDVERPGVFEVPLGTTFREVIEAAGGVRGGKRLKAFLPGGASSLFLRADAVDTKIDLEAVRQAGSMLGTGAIIVFDEDHDLFQAAANVTRFFRNESCGKCVPCRVGSEQGVRLLEAATEQGLSSERIEFLGELEQTLLETSICGLGQVALAPMLSMLKRFPEEIP